MEAELICMNRMRLIIGVKKLIVLLQNYKTQYMLLAFLLQRYKRIFIDN